MTKIENTELALVKDYIRNNPDFLLPGLYMLKESWNCNENKFSFDFDELVFFEATEFYEESSTQILLQIMKNQDVINLCVELEGRPILVSSFIQLQKQVRQHFDNENLEELSMNPLPQVVNF